MTNRSRSKTDKMMCLIRTLLSVSKYLPITFYVLGNLRLDIPHTDYYLKMLQIIFHNVMREVVDLYRRNKSRKGEDGRIVANCTPAVKSALRVHQQYSHLVNNQNSFTKNFLKKYFSNNLLSYNLMPILWECIK